MAYPRVVRRRPGFCQCGKSRPHGEPDGQCGQPLRSCPHGSIFPLFVPSNDTVSIVYAGVKATCHAVDVDVLFRSGRPGHPEVAADPTVAGRNHERECIPCYGCQGGILDFAHAAPWISPINRANHLSLVMPRSFRAIARATAARTSGRSRQARRNLRKSESGAAA